MSQVIVHDERNGRVRIPAWLIYVAVAIGSATLSAFVGYTTAASATNTRVSVLETQYEQLRSDITELKTDVKALLKRP